ncbi:MAG: hypothetical protein LIO74_10325 [Ruminococcus sp.]|nr:hypothetical protein [Ruminococcus sp.]
MLTNFSENGFVDGATYNGFTIHVTQNADGSYTRTLIYSVNNGSTKQLQLVAKFANGTTADGETATVTISSGRLGRFDLIHHHGDYHCPFLDGRQNRNCLLDFQHGSGQWQDALLHPKGDQLRQQRLEGHMVDTVSGVQRHADHLGCNVRRHGRHHQPNQNRNRKQRL